MKCGFRTCLMPGRAAAATFARCHWARFVDYDGAAHQVLAMAGINGTLRGGIVTDFHKTKPTSLSSETIAHDGYRIDRHAILGKEIL